MALFDWQKQLLVKTTSQKGQRGFSSNEMVVVLACIGILATLTVPSFVPVIEMAEVLIAEKYLLGAVKECQMGLINGEANPIYTLPPQSIGVGFLSNSRFELTSTGIEGECFSFSNENILSASRNSGNQTFSTYSLNIHLVTGEKTTEGVIPSWLDWWEGIFSPLISENDPLLDD